MKNNIIGNYPVGKIVLQFAPLGLYRSNKDKRLPICGVHPVYRNVFPWLTKEPIIMEHKSSYVNMM